VETLVLQETKVLQVPLVMLEIQATLVKAVKVVLVAKVGLLATKARLAHQVTQEIQDQMA
jgi:aspartate/glutamate racemase